jgi:ribosomal protein L37AE/L43A
MDRNDKIKKFVETFPQKKAMVVCVKCGSTEIDQNDLNLLKCYTCGNTMPWNAAEKFAVIRIGTLDNETNKKVIDAMMDGPALAFEVAEKKKK